LSNLHRERFEPCHKAAMSFVSIGQPVKCL
jgi:hypothetical protein